MSDVGHPKPTHHIKLLAILIKKNTAKFLRLLFYKNTGRGHHKPYLCCNTHVIIDLRPHNPVFKNMNRIVNLQNSA